MKRTMRIVAGVLIATSLLAGCKASPPPTGSPGTATDTTATNLKGEPLTTAQSETKSTEAEQVGGQPLSLIPASLKNDAFYYYGFQRSKPTDFLYTVTGAQTQQGVGGESFVLKGVKDGVATFAVRRTGALESSIGSEVVTLDQTGVKMESITLGDLAGQPMELPAKLTPGTTWTAKYAIDLKKSDQFPNGAKLQAEQTYKVIGPEKLTVKAGTFDTLLIEETEDDEIDGKKTSSQAKMWLAKDFGTVKIVQTVPSPQTTVTIEATSDPAAK